MGETSISWTDESSNPIRFRRKDTGKKGWACIKESAGCKSCYSERTNKWVGTGLGYTVPNMELVEPFIVEKEVNRLLGLVQPRKIFIGDMTDLFGDFIPSEMLFQVFAVMALCARQTFQVLTKRADRMEAFLSDPETPDALMFYVNKLIADHHFCPFEFAWPLPNLWLGVTVEDSSQVSRIDHLLRAPAVVRFVSCEPLLSALDLSLYLKCQWYQDTEHPVPWKRGDIVDREKYPHQGYPAMLRPCIDWVVAGFETGKAARPGHPDWVRGLRDQCQASGIPFHFKSWGEWIPKTQIADFHREPNDQHPLPGWWVRDEWQAAIKGVEWGCLEEDGTYWKETTTWNGRQEAAQDNHEVTIYRVGHKASGRTLDGKIWDQFPGDTRFCEATEKGLLR